MALLSKEEQEILASVFPPKKTPGFWAKYFPKVRAWLSADWIFIFLWLGVILGVINIISICIYAARDQNQLVEAQNDLARTLQAHPDLLSGNKEEFKLKINDTNYYFKAEQKNGNWYQGDIPLSAMAMPYQEYLSQTLHCPSNYEKDTPVVLGFATGLMVKACKD
jgi:hypothetical protein